MAVDDNAYDMDGDDFHDCEIMSRVRRVRRVRPVAVKENQNQQPNFSSIIQQSFHLLWMPVCQRGAGAASGKFSSF